VRQQRPVLLQQHLCEGEQLMRLIGGTRALLVAAALVAGAAQAAQAAPRRAAPTYDQKQEKIARAHFDEAESAFNLAHFEEALAGYQAAYEALPLPAFLFNIAQCHRNLRNHEQAVFFYQRYLSLAPDASNRAVVEDLITEEKRLSAEAAPAAPDLNARPEPAATAVAGLGATPAGEGEQGRWNKARWWLLGALGAALVGGVALLAIRTGGAPPSGSLGNIDARR
jgi:tetratricopeptide (TPR) repeat protein